MQEKNGARRGLRHDGGRMRRVEGGGWRERKSCWKGGGGQNASLYLGEGRLPDEASLRHHTGRGRAVSEIHGGR